MRELASPSTGFPRYLWLRIFLTIWATYLIHFNAIHDGANRFVYLSMAVAEHGEISLDSVHPSITSDLIQHNGKYYNNTNPGLSFLAVPACWIAARFYNLIGNAFALGEDAHYLFMHLICFMFTTAIASSLAAVMLGRFVFHRTRSLSRSILAAFLYAFGTIAFHFSTHSNQNCVIACLGVLLFLLIFEPGLLAITGNRRQSLLFGLLAGTGVLIDLSIVPCLAVLGVAFLSASVRRKTTVSDCAYIALAFVPFLLVLGLYQYAIFSNPFYPPQSYYPVTGMMGVMTWATRASFPRLLDNFIFPSHGLIAFMPFTLLSFWYFFTHRKPGPQQSQIEKLTVAILFLVYLVYVFFNFGAKFSQFGPRYLMPIIPFTVLLFALYYRPKDLSLGTLLVVSSFLINGAGAQLGYGTDDLIQFLSLYAWRGPWLPIFNLVGDAGFPTFFSKANLPASPFGPFVLLATFLLILWIPVWKNKQV